MEGEGIRDKRWNRLERRREGELLGTEARGGTAWNGGERGNCLERRREGNGYSVYYNKKLG